MVVRLNPFVPYCGTARIAATLPASSHVVSRETFCMGPRKYVSPSSASRGHCGALRCMQGDSPWSARSTTGPTNDRRRYRDHHSHPPSALRTLLRSAVRSCVLRHLGPYLRPSQSTDHPGAPFRAMETSQLPPSTRGAPQAEPTGPAGPRKGQEGSQAGPASVGRYLWVDDPHLERPNAHKPSGCPEWQFGKLYASKHTKKGLFHVKQAPS